MLKRKKRGIELFWCQPVVRGVLSGVPEALHKRQGLSRVCAILTEMAYSFQMPAKFHAFCNNDLDILYFSLKVMQYQ